MTRIQVSSQFPPQVYPLSDPLGFQTPTSLLRSFSRYRTSGRRIHTDHPPRLFHLCPLELQFSFNPLCFVNILSLDLVATGLFVGPSRSKVAHCTFHLALLLLPRLDPYHLLEL